MERITPLAKILAEANGIEWQSLRGSGDSEECADLEAALARFAVRCFIGV